MNKSMPRWRWMVRGRGRPPKHRFVQMELEGFMFAPLDSSGAPMNAAAPPIHMRPDEFEALRLVYLEGMTQDEAARRMNVSRGTLWRALDSGRRKLVQALVEKRPLVISP